VLSSCLIRSDFQATSSSLRAAFVLPDTLLNFTVTLDFSGLVLEWRLKADCAEGEIQTAFAEGVMRTMVRLAEKGLLLEG